MLGARSWDSPFSYEELVGLSDGSLRLRYVVQIKNPYAYAVSINRWERARWSTFEKPPSTAPLDLWLMHQKCADFNAAYRSYWPLIASARAILVRYEDLLEDATRVLRRLRDEFGLTPKHAVLEDVSEIVAPRVGISGARFYRSYYVNKEYLHALTAALKESIAMLIDWDLMRRYGYERGE